MHSRPFNTLGRILLMGCAVGLSAPTVFGQSSSSSSMPAAPAAQAQKQSESRSDLFLGYSYLAPHGNVTTPQSDGTTFTGRYSAVNYGAIGSWAYYFNRYVGGQLQLAVHPDGRNDGVYTGMAGMIFRYPTEGMTPFVHALAGGVRLGGPNDEPYAAHPYQWGPALEVGGGLDFDITKRFSLRLFQADYDYYHADYGPQPGTGGRANVESAQLSTGIVMHFGSIVPPAPLAYSCSASPTSVFPGDPITITGNATNVLPKKTVTYSWTGSNGVNVSGTDSTTKVETGSLQPGNYTVTGHAMDGKKPGRSADCTAQFTVKQFEPPTISCSANPTSVKPGESSTVTCNGVSPQNRPLIYSYSASAGSINGTGNSATLNTTGAPSGSITVTGNVQDDKGQTASATTTVDVQAPPPPPPAPKSKQLCSIQFNNDKRRPARVDNEAKACLDDVALNAQQQSDASLVVVGNAAQPSAPMHGRHHRTHEMSPEKLAAQRAVNTKNYLVTEKGIDANRVQVRTGTNGQDEVEDYLVPAGANFDQDVQGTTAVDENSVKAQPRKAVAHHHHHHHAAAKKAQQ